MIKHFIAAAAGLTAAVAHAEDTPKDDLRIRVGLGARVQPSFIGSDKREVAPLWDIDVARGDKLFQFEAPDDKFAVPVYNKNSFSFGPTANIEWKRKAKDVGVAVDNVPTTFEAGVYAQYQPLESIRLRADLRKGIGGHQGIVGGISLDKIWRDGDKYVFSVGPRLSFSDGRYQRAYFGVDNGAALASGLPVYRPGGGVHGVGMASGLTYQFNPRFGMFGFAKYERLVGDAAKSPIVREYGSRTQLSAGLGLTYTFNVKR
ncbi:MipA/OmpV family protein [Sphingomonas jaspsi]|uniref:MipA/OmpV family protein n=1 Tax=Sphingomonas jaspsi TaxID=392409 RepID=UPI0004B08E45|nr:MipA/OmpV family protein [Sphingomonas jaspsi]